MYYIVYVIWDIYRDCYCEYSRQFSLLFRDYLMRCSDMRTHFGNK